MAEPGTDANPLRVAVVGSGPTAFYTAQHLFNEKGLAVSVDLFERLPTPFGLVRLGVAPDHPKIKSVEAVYNKTASHPAFRFFGNVEVGKDVSITDLGHHYHQIVLCTGAQTDRRLGIPGEDLDGSYTATEFVAWYNGHPDFAERRFDLSRECAVVVGIGNVAVDVARVLCRNPATLATTDIANHALEALFESKVREVFLLGRRGPAQAAFSNSEIKELGEIRCAETSTLAEDLELDAISRRRLDEKPDKMIQRKLEIMRAMVGRSEPEKQRRLKIRFLTSPVEIIGDRDGKVRAVRVVRNELFEDAGGAIRCRPTEVFDEIPAGLVFRSVGYRGIAVPGVPFREDWGIIPNEQGRVVDPTAGTTVQGLYVAGWIKRGPQGVIGTNKPDALETVRCMLEDLRTGNHLRPERSSPGDAEKTIRERQPEVFSYGDWTRLDALERERGAAQDRPRVKFTAVEEMRAALGR